MLYVFFLILNLIFALLMFFMVLAFFTGAPYVPTFGKTRNTMMDFAGIRKGLTVADLGSGDGRLLFAAAQLGASGVGYEINPFLVIVSYIWKLLFFRRSDIRIYWKNFWKADLTGTDVAFIYLIPARMEKLEAKLKREMKSGSLVISNSFIFPGWKILKADRNNHVYAFKIP